MQGNINHGTGLWRISLDLITPEKISMKMGKRPNCDKNKVKYNEFLPCSIFQTGKIYLYHGNQTRVIQKLAKYDSQKC